MNETRTPSRRGAAGRDGEVRGEIVWTFNRAGEFEFACLIAGHFQAGMVGAITFVPAGKA